jgi:hypothetical protein
MRLLFTMKKAKVRIAHDVAQTVQISEQWLSTHI